MSDRKIKVRLQNGNYAWLHARDLGIRPRCLRGRCFLVYCTKFYLNGLVKYSRIPLDEADVSGDAARIRERRDEEVLAKMGIDCGYREMFAA